MNKISFSVYQLLSFIAPGLFAIFLADLYAEIIWKKELGVLQNQNLSSSIFLLALALFLGLIFQIIGTKLKGWISKYCSSESKENLFKRCMIKFQDFTNRPLSVYEHKSKLMNILPILKQKIRSLSPETFRQETVTIGQLFTIAYNYLEVEGKNTAVQTYHSFYNCLYYMMTASMVAIVLILVDMAFHSTDNNLMIRLIFVIALLSLVVILMPLMKWQRNTMIHKLFLNYYAHLLHSNGNR